MDNTRVTKELRKQIRPMLKANGFMNSTSRVLEFFKERYRFAQEFDPDAEPFFVLRSDTTVRDWQTACDLLPAEQLGKALNSIFAISCPDDQWKHALNGENILGNVCSLISESGAKRADCRPMKLAGRDCNEAGVFLAFRSMLSEAGLPAADLRPSSELGPLLDQHFGTIVDVMGKLAPGVLPFPTSRFSEHFGNGLGLLLLTSAGILILFHAMALDLFWVTLIVVAANIIAWSKCNDEIQKRFKSNYYIQGVRTLADLTRLIVQHRSL